MTTPDQKLIVTQEMLAKLAELRNQPKFIDMPGTIYNGMRPETARRQAENHVDTLIDRLRDGLPTKPSKKFVLSEFARTMDEIEVFDTEDRERFLSYLEEIMEISGIASSDGLLNRWMYGPILGRLADEEQKKRAQH